MSRWAAEFAQHPFQAIWKALKDELSLIEVDDQTVLTSVDELARLKKVIAYLDEIISSVDPDITPKSVWAAFHPQADSCLQQVRSYVSNRNITHVIQANEHADNLLTYLKPYLILPEEVIRALQNSARSYVTEVEKYVEAFRDKSTVIVKQLEDNKKLSTSCLSRTESNGTKIDKFVEHLFVGTEEIAPVEKAIEDTKRDIDIKAGEISALHTTLLVGDASTKTVVAAAEKEIGERRDEIVELLEAVDSEVKQLDAFHTKIFGEKNDSTGEPVSGLKYELDQRMAQLSAFESAQNNKHSALFQKIESLLPGATSAGLASAYGALREKFSKPIARYTWLFYGSLSVLILAAIFISVRHLTIYPTVSVDFVEVAEWDYVLRALLYKTPFIAPVIWLAIFSTTRRSQYERLQQEYAHKEALATSYDSYKKQIQELKGESEDLQKQLISKAIEAIAYNASVTLDGKHEDKLPVQHLLEKLSLDDAKKLLEMLKASK